MDYSIKKSQEMLNNALSRMTSKETARYEFLTNQVFAMIKAHYDGVASDAELAKTCDEFYKFIMLLQQAIGPEEV